MKRKIALLTVGMALFNAKALFVCGSMIPKARADSLSKNFTTTATVSPRCSFASGNSTLQFGVYDPQQHVNVDANALLDIRCTKGAAVTLGLDNGIYSSGATRRMKNTVENQYLDYQLYSNPARTTIWNNTSTVSLTSTSSANQTVTVYGRIPTGQSSAKGGDYTDTVTITATF